MVSYQDCVDTHDIQEKNINIYSFCKFIQTAAGMVWFMNIEKRMNVLSSFFGTSLFSGSSKLWAEMNTFTFLFYWRRRNSSHTGSDILLIIYCM